MGCDIHIYRERFAAGRWQSVDTWSKYDGEDEDVSYPNQCYEGRNYDLFGALAKGVRRDFDFAFAPRGLPLACDPHITKIAEGDGVDGHSHSYLYLHELRELRDWCNAHTIPVAGMMDAAQLADLKASIDAGTPNWDRLYPYCQWASDSSRYVQFELDVPASFKFGECLDKIIASFDGCDGENHRVVFWFDN